MKKQATVAALALSSLLHMGTAVAAITETRSDNWIRDPGVRNGRFEPYVWPYWRLDVEVGGADLQGTVKVTSDAEPFQFKSIVLYSSIGSIPYTFVGKLGSQVVFTANGNSPWPEGEFIKFNNPYSSVWIDTLDITLTNAAYSTCGGICSNPIGYRDVLVTTSSVPEPGVIALSAIGVLAVLGKRKRRVAHV